MFKRLLIYLIYDRNWLWVEWIICTLAELEMQIKLLKDREFKDYLDTCVMSDGIQECDAYKEIPKDTFYCYDGGHTCKFHAESKIARNILGECSSGYCYFMGKGDFSFVRPTQLIWDYCKECGVSYYDGND